MVMIGVGVTVRTGRVIGLSAAWLAMVPTAGLPQNDASPDIAGELDELFG